MGKRTPPSDSQGPIEPVDLREALEQRYLAYALSTIMHRALPDVRDGLKPVHRRLLYAMQQLRLSPQGEFRKCAKIVGDTMGNFHPHGNQAIYDALARLAQDFTVRYPLVDGQGNFGNIDGDNPAAERYTEARLTEVAARLLDGIDEDTVDFRANYDGREQEPSVLPANFPNLLANGASGIAVGMATNRSTTRWCAWHRISPRAIRWSTARAISATSTAITPRRCATPRAGSPPWPSFCSTALTRTRSISA